MALSSAFGAAALTAVKKFFAAVGSWCCRTRLDVGEEKKERLSLQTSPKHTAA